MKYYIATLMALFCASASAQITLVADTADAGSLTRKSIWEFVAAKKGHDGGKGHQWTRDKQHSEQNCRVSEQAYEVSVGQQW